ILAAVPTSSFSQPAWMRPSSLPCRAVPPLLQTCFTKEKVHLSRQCAKVQALQAHLQVRSVLSGLLQAFHNMPAVYKNRKIYFPCSEYVLSGFTML
ncbi:hypothetical protein XENOCAPTIV_001027, partial [Xenoophorus captivus]